MSGPSPLPEANKTDRAVCVVMLNEGSLLTALWSWLRGDEIVIVDCDADVVLMRPLVLTLRRLLLRSTRVRTFDDLFGPDETAVREEWTFRAPDFFSGIEATVERQYRFDEAEAAFGTAAPAYKQIICKQTELDMKNVMRMSAVDELLAGRRCHAHGMSADVIALYSFYFKGGPIIPWQVRSRASGLSNRLSAAMTVGSGLAYLVRKLRVVSRRVKYDIASDVTVFDWRHAQLLEGLSQTHQRILLVFRNKHELATAARDWPAASKFDMTAQSSGHVPVRSAFRFLLDFCGETAAVWRAGRNLRPSVFREVIKIPTRTAIYRAFTERFDCEIFFAKDDYNFEHILRTNVMRERGVLAAGMNHGLPVPEIVSPVWRYIDYDLYFVFGRAIQAIYAGTWSRRMQICPVGVIAMDRSQFDQAKTRRPQDFVIFFTPIPEQDEWIAELFRLAEKYPDQTFYFKHKRSTPDSIRAILARYGAAVPPNVVETGEKAYPLILRCRYAVSTRNTTVAAEAIQMNALSYVLDVTPSDMVSYYRQFDGLVFDNADDIANNIAEVEAGRLARSREDFRDLIEVADLPLVELVRNALESAKTGSSRLAAA